MKIGRAFWYVHNPSGKAPRHKHFSELLARQEAERLARSFPGSKFIVLQAVAQYTVAPDPIEVTELTMCNSEEPPF